MKASELAARLLELAKIEDLEVMTFYRDYRGDLGVSEIGEPSIVGHEEIIKKFKDDDQVVPDDVPNKFISV